MGTGRGWRRILQRYAAGQQGARLPSQTTGGKTPISFSLPPMMRARRAADWGLGDEASWTVRSAVAAGWEGSRERPGDQMRTGRVAG